MDKNRFLEFLDIYGGDLDRWPEGIRREALAACSSSPELGFLLEEERRFEGMLAGSAAEEPPAGLEARIIASARPRKAQARRRTLAEYLGGVLSALPIPTPRFAIPLLLVTGMAAGYFYASYVEYEEEPVQLAGVLYYEEGIYEEGIYE